MGDSEPIPPHADLPSGDPVAVNICGPGGDPAREAAGQSQAIGSAVNGLAREWAQCDDRNRADYLFEAVVRAAERELCEQARRIARRLAGPEVVDDVINEAWLRLLKARTYDPDRGPSFGAYFLAIVRHLCMDAIRSQATAPEPVSNVTMEKADPDGGLFATAAAADDEVDLADLRARIDAAIEVLDLTKAHRAMLHMLICPEQETSDAANGRASQATRKARERLRNRIGELACLSPEEARAAALLRKHHTVARAAAASGVNEKDLRDALAFAKRKVLALFDIESED